MNDKLGEVARRTDAASDRARSELVRAVRSAYAGGMTQSQIASEIGRSQPEVNRLLRFHGSTAHARALRDHSGEVRALIRDAGGRRVRVFGSTANGHDAPGSDVDLLFEMTQPLSLMQLSAIEQRLSELIGTRVDLVPESSLRADLRESILAEAVPL